MTQPQAPRPKSGCLSGCLGGCLVSLLLIGGLTVGGYFLAKRYIAANLDGWTEDRPWLALAVDLLGSDEKSAPLAAFARPFAASTAPEALPDFVPLHPKALQTAHRAGKAQLAVFQIVDAAPTRAGQDMTRLLRERGFQAEGKAKPPRAWKRGRWACRLEVEAALDLERAEAGGEDARSEVWLRCHRAPPAP